MKTFGILLVMLCSFSFVKAQTMVVEMADSSESFEVGEIKRFSAFKKNFKFLKIEFLNIPVVIKNEYNQDENFNYSGWQRSYNETLKYDNNIIHKDQSVFCAVNCYLFRDNKISGTNTANDDAYYIEVIIDDAKDQINYFHFLTSGGMGGCWDGNKYNCDVYGFFDVELQGIPFMFEQSNLISIIKGANIEKYLKRLVQDEKLYLWSSHNTLTAYIKSIREAELTDDSQIIITIE